MLFLVKHLIWDYDGTLYQSQEIGGVLKPAFLNFVKTHRPDAVDIFNQLTDQGVSWSASASRATRINELQVLEEVESQIDKLKYVHPNPQIVKFIEDTQSRFCHYILTNSKTSEVEAGLKKIGFSKSPFKKIFARDTTLRVKPNPEIFKEIQALTHAPRFRHLCIGDSLHSDVEPALKFGFQAIPIWELNRLFPKLF